MNPRLLLSIALFVTTVAIIYTFQSAQATQQQTIQELEIKTLKAERSEMLEFDCAAMLGAGLQFRGFDVGSPEWRREIFKARRILHDGQPHSGMRAADHVVNLPRQ